MAGSADSGDKDVYDEINITPMLDLAYVLMIIFIIMTTATVQGIKVNLPKASATPTLAKPQWFGRRSRRPLLSRAEPAGLPRQRLLSRRQLSARRNSTRRCRQRKRRQRLRRLRQNKRRLPKQSPRRSQRHRRFQHRRQ